MQLEDKEDRQTHARKLLTKLNALNIYHINIIRTLHVMYTDLAPRIFNNYFELQKHKYYTRNTLQNLI